MYNDEYKTNTSDSIAGDVTNCNYKLNETFLDVIIW